MKLYARKDFIELPEMTIYSRVTPNRLELCHGLFCKTSGPKDYKNDFVEQDLISEGGFPDGIEDGMEAILHQCSLRDSFDDFRTDLNCAGRDGMFEEEGTFVVWDREDVVKLRDYLNKVLGVKSESPG